jgi:hypothetical protein
MAELDRGGGGSLVAPRHFVDDGEILIGKLTGTILGSIWLTAVSGWITISRAIATVHVRFLLAGRDAYVAIFETLGQEAQATFLESWAAAFQASVEVNPLLAPAIFSAEILVVVAILLALRRRVLT